MTAVEKVLGVVGTVFAGLGTLLSGLVDPSWLLANNELWYSIAVAILRWVGPGAMPDVPWDALLLLASLVYVTIMLIQIQKRQNEEINE